MRKRCSSPASADFKHYGGRGIRVCKRWEEFDVFLADMGAPPRGATIEREDNDAHYAPGNCRWATRAEQANNTRANVRIRSQGVELSMADFARHHGMKYDVLRYQLKKGRRVIGGIEVEAIYPPRA